MRIVFFGSPDFAVPSLERLLDRHEVVKVVTQPDKPAGRGGSVTAPPVKQVATARGLPVVQPKSARGPELLAELAAANAEIGVVVAYGKILPKALLEAFPRGCINVHGSLLPRYRGAAPIQWAVINGDAETGASIMQLDEGMDTGPVILERRVAIGPEETAGELFARLAPLGADALIDALDQLAAGTARLLPQDGSLASHAPMLTKADGWIRFDGPAAAVAARIRGVDPWPGAVSGHRGQPMKLFRARSVDGGGVAGQVLAIDGDGVVIACTNGAVQVRELQLPGGKRMAAEQLARGRAIAVGDVLQVWGGAS